MVECCNTHKKDVMAFRNAYTVHFCMIKVFRDGRGYLSEVEALSSARAKLLVWSSCTVCLGPMCDTGGLTV